MSGQSLGLIETVGLTVAVEAADAAMKSANVDLAGYELTKGCGLVTVKLMGEVGAINAAVSAGVAAANRVGSVYAWKVIARTATGIDDLIASKEAYGVVPQEPMEQNSTSGMEHKDEIIPVVNIEPGVAAVDCLVQADDVKTDTQAPTVPLTETEPAQREDDVELVPVTFEEASEQITLDNKKPLRTKAKSTRRQK